MRRFVGSWLFSVLVIVFSGLLASVTAALADESPMTPQQLTAYRLDWLNYVAAEDLPTQRFAVCIVDTGTAVTPDTPVDDPGGPIIERLSTDGGPGTPQGTAPEQMHGTRMAMDALAAVNGWGTVGATTWGRVVSVRAQVKDETGLRQDSYRKGMARCREAQSREPIAAVSLSFGCGCSFSSDEDARIADAIGRARQAGLSVVAAAGNGGGATDSPARYPGVLAVAGGGPDGSLCTYSSHDDHVGIVGPACPVEDADPLTGVPSSDMGAGSSASAVITATFVAAIRTLKPDASAYEIEAWIRDSAREVGSYRMLDGEAAARMAGLGPVVDRARARMLAVSSGSPVTPTATTGPEEPTTVALIVKPIAPSDHRRIATPRRVRARWAAGRLTVLSGPRPRKARLEVRAERVGEFGLADASRRRIIENRRLTWALPWRPDRLRVRWIPARDLTAAASRVRILKRARSGRFR